VNKLLLTFLACFITLTALSSTLTREYNFDIRRSNVPHALKQFSEQTGLQIGYLPESPVEQAKLVGPVRGRLSVQSALTQLLEHSGLVYEFVNDRTIAVTPGATIEYGSNNSASRAVEPTD
jgi:hypothetical protein